jgi:TPP-dependent indolepyruvate ferredoxin oxidoreductase alpha subunit
LTKAPATSRVASGACPTPAPTHLLRANADLNPAIIARALAKRLTKLGVPDDVAARLQTHLALLDAKEQSMSALTLSSTAERQPWFCSGCPHNTSTKVPEGSRAMAGIGCHFMTIWMDRATVGFTQMGGEGVPWVGQQPFSTDQHMFANLGDGTYFHSGLLAVRQSIAAGREHHLQNSVQRRRGHDRWPASGRAARGPQRGADRQQHARRGCPENHHRHRRARKIRPA